MRLLHSARMALFGAFVVAPLAIAEAGTVHGTVVNGTTGRPAAGIELTLVQLQERRAGRIHVRSPWNWRAADAGPRDVSWRQFQ